MESEILQAKSKKVLDVLYKLRYPCFTWITLQKHRHIYQRSFTKISTDCARKSAADHRPLSWKGLSYKCQDQNKEGIEHIKLSPFIKKWHCYLHTEHVTPLCTFHPIHKRNLPIQFGFFPHPPAPMLTTAQTHRQSLTWNVILGL